MHFRYYWPRDRMLGLRVRIPPDHGYLSLVSVECCEVDISATGRKLIQRISTESGVSDCDRETDGGGLFY
jgi:hypothetical protein